MTPAFYRLLFALAYTDKFPFVSFSRDSAFLHSARERLYRKHGLVTGNLEGLAIGLDVRDSVDLLCWIGRFERELRAFLRTTVVRGATVIDAGAHIGVYTHLFSRWVGPGGRVVAFEPEPAAASRLESSLRRNGCSNVQIHRTALGESEARLQLHVTQDSAFSSLGTPVNGATVVRRLPVAVTSLDEFCRREGITHIDLLKMDLEGYEVPALRGAAGLLKDGRVDLLAVEYNRAAQTGNGFDARALGSLLTAAGYSARAVTRQGLSEFVNDGSAAYAELICARTSGKEA